MNPNKMEERLIEFSVLVTKIVMKMPNTTAGKYFARQMLKSGTTPALRYRESQNVESRQMHIQKMNLVSQNLREVLICLTILKKSGCHNSESLLNDVLIECNELNTILVCSIHTSKKRSTSTL